MANEALAPVPATPPSARNEDEYQTFCAALSASERGRTFLAEYVRRYRGADTEMLSASLARIEAMMRAQRAGAEPARGELRALLSNIHAVRPEIAASTVPVRAAKLAQLLDMLERRLEALVEPGSPVPSGDMRLAVVPQPQEPELPIPSPYAAQPALTLAIDYRGQPAVNHPAPVVTAAIIMPKATWFGGSPPSPDNFIDARHRGNAALPSMAEKVAALSLHAQTNPATRPEPFAQRSQAMPLLPPPDPLAPLMLLSEEERLALFT